MRKALIILWVVILLISGCVPAIPSTSVTETQSPFRTPTLFRTPKPSRSPYPTLTPTTPAFTATASLSLTPSPTSTPQPPLVEHEWTPETILISLRDDMGDGGMLVGDLGPPHFILYVNGSLFVTKRIVTDQGVQTEVLIKKLNREGICKHLNTLDQVGYLDYDSSNYEFIGGGNPLVLGAPDTFINVNSWVFKSDQYYELSYFLEKDNIDAYYGQKGYPVIDPALRDAYYFLSDYPKDGFELYKPDRLAVWISPLTNATLDYLPTPEKWELDNPSLTQLFMDAKPYVFNENQEFIILSGAKAKSVYAYLGEIIGVRYFEGDGLDGSNKYYAVFARPLLPYETPGEYYMSEFPNLPKPDFKLHCYPSDGILPIPTPFYP